MDDTLSQLSKAMMMSSNLRKKPTVSSEANDTSRTGTPPAATTHQLLIVHCTSPQTKESLQSRLQLVSALTSCLKGAKTRFSDARKVEIFLDLAHSFDAMPVIARVRPAVSARVAAAKKCYMLSTASGGEHKVQQEAAARDKIRILLAQPVLGELHDGSGAGGSGSGSGKTESKAAIRKKMEWLGMIQSHYARKGEGGGGGGAELREAALTRWMDKKTGTEFRGQWSRDIRSGASAEPASRELAKLAATMRTIKMEEDGRNNKNLEVFTGHVARSLNLSYGGTGWSSCGHTWCQAEGGKKKKRGRFFLGMALAGWKSNPTNGRQQPQPENMDEDESSPQAVDRDFGDFPRGKACGHNEAVMNYLRPFASMEVINTRICSAADPAPGNEVLV